MRVKAPGTAVSPGVVWLDYSPSVERGTRTPTPEGTRLSSWRVYQFHHFDVVARKGVEPSRPKTLVSKTSVAASYTTSPWSPCQDLNPALRFTKASCFH